MLGLEDLVFALLFQAGVSAMFSDFTQSGFQTCLLIGVAAGFGLLDLVHDALLLGCAACQAGSVLGSHHGSGHDAAKGQQGEWCEKFHKSSMCKGIRVGRRCAVGAPRRPLGSR